MKLASFADCISASSSGKRHLLLGNGFSRACRDTIFSYDSIFEAADWGKDSERIRSVFNAIDSRDFEHVMECLELCSKLEKPYGLDQKSSKAMRADAVRLRKVLVETLSKHHPESPNLIRDAEYNSCRTFLRHFERIYSLNYDLLLYWTFMSGKRQHDDGFRDPFEGESKDYVEEDFVEWKNFENQQTIYYLHGALHLFLDGPILKKCCWSRTGIKLKDQILAALEKRNYPLIVTAGKSSEKLTRIQRSNYLGHGFRSIRKITGSLFIYGHSMGEKDDHILKQISGNTSLNKLYVGVFGDVTSKANKDLIKNAKAIEMSRQESKKKLVLTFFDSASAKVWKD